MDHIIMWWRHAASHTTLQYYATMEHAELSQKLIIPKISREFALIHHPPCLTILGPQNTKKDHDNLRVALARKLAQVCLDKAATLSDDDDDNSEGQYVVVLHSLLFLRYCQQEQDRHDCEDETFFLLPQHDDTTIVPFLLLAEAYLSLWSLTTPQPRTHF